MRYIYLIAFLIVINISCKNEHPINISELSFYIEKTDSINDHLSVIYNTTLEEIYRISDDSLAVDSISKLVQTPDSLLFFQFLEYTIGDLKRNYYSIQQEIFFSKDQLIGLKEDVGKNKISRIQYELQLESEKKMLDLLTERVDSNIKILRNVSKTFYLQTDSIF
jgi:hypothetical protein